MSASKYLDETGLAYFWDKVKDHVSEAIANGTSDVANSIHFAIPNEKSAAATLTATINDIESLTPGLIVALELPFDNVNATTLNINALGAKPVYYKNNIVDAGVFPSGTIALLVYETTSVATGCFKAVYSYNAQPSIYQGSTDSANGISGLVPSATSEERNKFLKGDGTWGEVVLPAGATATELTTGTETTLKTISPKVIHDYVVSEVSSGVAGLVNSAPTALDTLNELAAALGNDPNFATTISTNLGGKLDASSANYVKSLSISGQTITVTKGDNTTGTLTTQDTTYSAGTGMSLSGTEFSVASTAGSSSLAWNTETTLGTVGGLAIKAQLPANPHKVPHLYVGASGATSNAATTTNTTTFISAVDGTTASDSIQITGSGGASVTAANGVITIDTPSVSSITTAQIDALFA